MANKNPKIVEALSINKAGKSDVDKDLEPKRSSTSFSDDPLKYCQLAIKEGRKHNEKFREDIQENWEFYEAIDKDLEDRAANDDVIRSSMFVNEVRPTIDTRFATALDRLEEASEPLQLTISTETKEEVEKMEQRGMENSPLSRPDLNEKGLRKKQKVINDHLKKAKYFFQSFQDHFYGAEMQPTSVVKIIYDDDFKMVAEIDKYSPFELIKYFLKFRKFPPHRKPVWKYKNLGKKFTIQWIPWDYFIYDEASIDRNFDDAEFVGHINYVTWNELVDLAKVRGWDMELMKEVRDGQKATSKDEDEYSSEIEDDSPAYPTIEREGVFQLAELWVSVIKKNGNPGVRRLMILNNKEMLENDASPYPGIKYPFVPYRASDRPGRSEGTATMTILKPMQRLNSDYYNGYNDGLTYSVFGPVATPPGQTFTERPRWGPGEIWEGVEITPVMNRNVDLRGIPNMIERTEIKIRQLGNAPDTAQGVQPSYDETATKTVGRIEGASRRFRPTGKRLADNIVQVCQYMIKMLQNDDFEWVTPDGSDFVMSVPVLSNVYTPDEERNESLLMYRVLKDDTLYADPMGTKKRRQLISDILDKFRVKDIDSRLLTEEEIEGGNMVIKMMESYAKIKEEQEQEKINKSEALRQGQGQSGMAEPNIPASPAQVPVDPTQRTEPARQQVRQEINNN